MTETAWTLGTDPRAMLEHVRQIPRVGRAKGRKHFLLAVACGRLVWSRITDERMRRVVRWAEAFADDNQDPNEWAEIVAIAQHVFENAYEAGGGRDQPITGDFAIALATHRLTQKIPLFAASAFLHASQGADGRNPTGAATIRDIFGNPFRPVAFDPSWRTSTVIALARQIYASGDFSAMPILADALQDAGCNSPDVLDHCRSSEPHARGCWCLDLLLGEPGLETANQSTHSETRPATVRNPAGHVARPPEPR